jgi:hypothetical protein
MDDDGGAAEDDCSSEVSDVPTEILEDPIEAGDPMDYSDDVASVSEENSHSAFMSGFVSGISAVLNAY